MSVEQRWLHYVRLTAVWVSGVVGLVVEAVTARTDLLGISILAAVVLGGFFAWLARDIVAAIERLRG